MAADIGELKSELAGIVSRPEELRSQIAILEEQKAAFEKVKPMRRRLPPS
ncbi:hypothetical protein [Sinorhizobium meliloti]|nr:hypothetical protein [Sinorhizobium meliloti]